MDFSKYFTDSFFASDLEVLVIMRDKNAELEERKKKEKKHSGIIWCSFKSI